MSFWKYNNWFFDLPPSLVENSPGTKMIYLASPYSHKNYAKQARRFFKISTIAAKLIHKYKYAFFCPITQSHTLRVYSNEDIGSDFKYWETIDKEVIRRSDELWVVCMEGWKKSIGVQEEIKYAKSINKPIKYLNARTLREIIK